MNIARRIMNASLGNLWFSALRLMYNSAAIIANSKMFIILKINAKSIFITAYTLFQVIFNILVLNLLFGDFVILCFCVLSQFEKFF